MFTLQGFSQTCGIYDTKILVCNELIKYILEYNIGHFVAVKKDARKKLEDVLVER